jgi:hypothetical protein
LTHPRLDWLAVFPGGRETPPFDRRQASVVELEIAASFDPRTGDRALGIDGEGYCDFGGRFGAALKIRIFRAGCG